MAKTASTEQPTSERAWNRNATIALALLVATALTSLIWFVHPWFEASDETHDAAIYIASARSLIAGDGYQYLGQPFTVRPPGWSLLIAPLIAWRGLDFKLLNVFTSLFGVAAVAFLFVHARARVGIACALAIAALVWFDADFQRLCNQVMSDVPGVALLFACLAVERWARAQPSLRRDLVLAACIGVSLYVRSVIVMLVPAIFVARALEYVLDRRAGAASTVVPRPSLIRFALTRLLPFAACVILIKLPWDVRNTLNHPDAPADQNYLYSYSTGMWHLDGGDPDSPRRALSDIAARVPVRAEQVTALLGSGMSQERGAGWCALGAAMLAATAWIAWRRRASAELFALAATCVLLVYFGFRIRLIVPIYAVALVASTECVLLAARRFARTGIATTVSTFAVAGGLAVLGYANFQPRAGWDEIERTHAIYSDMSAAVNAQLQPDDRVAAQIGWHYAVYMDRPVYSLFFSAKRFGEAGIEKVLSKYGIDVVLLTQRSAGDREMIRWFRQRYGEPVAAGDAVLFRVHR